MKHDVLQFEYSQITEQIYIGTNLCCQTHFAKSLLKKGITANISLEKEREDQAGGVEYYVWLPTKDHTAPTQKQLRTGVACLTSLVEDGVKIYVHCQRGHGRAPTLVAAYFISNGMTVEQAITFIKQKRPAIHPNTKQIAALKKFRKDIQ